MPEAGYNHAVLGDNMTAFIEGLRTAGTHRHPG